MTIDRTTILIEAGAKLDLVTRRSAAQSDAEPTRVLLGIEGATLQCFGLTVLETDLP